MSTATDRGGGASISRDWIVVVACLVCQIGMGAGGYLFPVFLKPIAEDLGWSRTTYSLANPVMSTTVALVGPIVGRLSDRIGPRVVLVAGSLLMSAALLGAGEMEDVRDFYLVAVLIGLGVACLGDLPTAAAIAGRFQNRRGLALGTVYIGSNLGGAIAPLVATAIAATASWRGALTAMGSTLWLLLLPFALLAAAPPRRDTGVGAGAGVEGPYGAAAEDGFPPRADLSSGVPDARTARPSSRARDGATVPDAREAAAEPVTHDAPSAVRQIDFWLLFWVVFVFYLYRLGVNTHLVAFLSDRGHSDQSAAGSFAAMLALGIAGKLLTGWLADRVGVWPATLGNFVLITVASALLLVPDVPLAIPVFLALHGFATAAEDVVVPLVVGRRFGSLHLASIYGVLLLALVPGGAAGPLLAGWTFDSTGSYAAVFALFLVGNLSAVAALWVVRRHS
jgi:MFS family permease